MVPLLLPYATTGLSSIAAWCGSGTTPRGQQGPPVCTLPPVRDGLRVRFRATLCPCGRSSLGRPVHRPFLRNALPDLTTIVLADHRLISADGGDRVPPSPKMVPGIVLAASHEGPGHVDRRFPLDKANDLRHRVLRRDGEEHMHVIRHQMPLFDATLLLLRQRAEDLPKMPPSLMGERFPTILRDKDHMILAVPLGMT